MTAHHDRPRTFTTERSVGFRADRALFEADRCRARITLDGTTYRCGRAHVDGIHDAFATHPGDQGLVRW